VGRIELSYEPRKCFLCDRAAKVCAKEKSHPVGELVAYMEEMVSQYLEDHDLTLK
jgi:holo-ACP synthase